MSYPQNNDADHQRAEIVQLIDAAIGGDVLTNSGGGFLAVMATSNSYVQQDIPAASEMYTLLAHYITSLPLYAVTLQGADVLLSPAVLYDEPAGKLVALLPIKEQELDLIAYWAAGGIRSDTVRAMKGLLALPFSIEVRDDVRHLIPEWFAAFYVNGSEEHCVPTLTLRSITQDERFGDWVAVALERMQVFGLPCDSASNAIHQKTSH
jgi:hypothetical protein